MSAGHGSFINKCVFMAFMFFLILMPSIMADALTTPIKVATSEASGATLGIPRWKGYMSELDPNNFWLSYASGSSSAGSMNYTTDAGATWSTDVLQIDFNGWLDFHLSLFGRNGELYFTWPGAHFRKFSSPATSNDDRGSLVTLSGTSDAHRSSIMVQNTGRVWAFSRLADNAAENVKYFYSDNNGTSWSSGVAYATNSGSVRIGSMPYVSGNPALVVLYLDDTRGFEYYLWNGSAFEVKSDHSIYAANMGQVRVFTHNVIKDTIMHLVFGYGNNLHHCWKNFNNGAGSWSHEIIDNSSNTSNNDWYPISTVKGNDLYVFYCKKSSSDYATSMIYYKKWSQLTQSWTAPILVSTAAANLTNSNPNTCFHVPDNANYIPVFWHCGSGPYDIYFSKILTNSAGGDTIPPGKVNDLGATPGGALGQLHLSWTTPGDDNYSGTADHYVIKYSTTPITADNWLSSATVTAPPTPLLAGHAQSCTVSGLTLGETYYFALRSYDEAGNVSQLSNIAFLSLSLDVTDNESGLPGQIGLKGNYPNPFNSSTTIYYYVSMLAHVTLSVYDILGEKINTLVDEKKRAGEYNAYWNGKDRQGNDVSSGIYFCHLKIDDYLSSRKMLLLK
jgi:hypothetical protein